MTNEEKEEEFKIECPHCGQHLAFDSTMFNQVFQCPACGGEVKIPPMPDSEPIPVVINVVRRGDGGEKRNRLLRTIGIASAVIVATILTVASAIYFLMVLIALLFGPDQEEMSEDSQPTTEQTAYSSDDDESVTTQEYAPSATLTSSERAAIGKLFSALAVVQSNRERIAEQISQQYDKMTADVAMGFSVRVFAEMIEKEDGWNDCPREFQTVFKNFCLTLGKADLLAVVEKYGSSNVLKALKQLNVHANFRKFYDDVIEEGAEAIAEEVAQSQAAFRAFMTKYGLSDNDLIVSATNEFVSQRYSASGLCKEFVGNRTYFTFVDDHTVRWDVGGESPPFICVATFSDDGTASLLQDNTFFARQYSGIPAKTLARMLKESFENDKYETEITNVNAEVRDGHLYFFGEIQVEPGNVKEKVNKLFHKLNVARLRLLI